MSDSDARKFGVLWAGWVGVSAVIFALGYGIEAMVLERVGEIVQFFGIIVFLSSASIGSSFVLSLPQRWRYVSYSGLVVGAAGLLGVMWRYSPESFERITTMMLLMGTVVCGAAVIMVSVDYFRDNDSRVEEEI